MDSYAKRLQSYLEPAANPTAAVYMKKYMKDQYEYLGIKSPERGAILAQFIRENGLPAPKEIASAITSLWKLPQREYQYCGMTIAQKAMKNVGDEFLKVVEYMIVTKSWWDTVDFVAVNVAGQFFKNFPQYLPEVPDTWSGSDNMWLIRSAILFQLKYKKLTDTKLLASYILPHTGSNEFFIRKAIGWALREYSKTDADWVRSFISKNTLKPLSVKEGLKWLNR